MRKIAALLLPSLITILGCAAILYAQTQKKPKTDVWPDSRPIYRVDNEFMLKYYDGFNAMYYDGKLPPITFEFQSNLKDAWGNPVMAMTSRTAPYHMRMEAGLRDFPPAAVESLIHESCHVHLEATNRVDADDDHGRNFQNCMLDKAERGAFRDLW